jgi:hypothetical protein
MIKNFAAEIAKDHVGETWVTDFLNRHTETLLYRTATESE